jgi:alcohol dehydrogenase/propanol-preferring alcohol dehydrogenase
MLAMQVKVAGGPFEMVDLPIPSPREDEVLIKVEACGICHSDQFVKEGMFPGLQLPRVPGHEVVGTIEEVGSEVKYWYSGQRVGVGWHGGHCFACKPCRRGDFINCENAKIAGITYDGGYAEYMVAPQEALALVPFELGANDAAPLLCAGITTFNALRNSGATPGQVVAIQGIGGLGHLALQYASKMGFRTIAISGGESKRDLALQLGAQVYVNASAENVVDVLQEMGGANVILATAPNSELMSRVVDGLALNGKLIVVGASMEPVTVSPLQLIVGRRSVSGWPAGTAMDSEDTLNFSQLTNIRPLVETFPLKKANEAYEHMLSNQARFRVVLVP